MGQFDRAVQSKKRTSEEETTMGGANRLGAVVWITTAVVVSGAATAIAATPNSETARSGYYSGTAYGAWPSAAVSSALSQAQSKGHAAGFTNCSETSQNVIPAGREYAATVYVSCYQP
jgi:hypothetical protein